MTLSHVCHGYEISSIHIDINIMSNIYELTHHMIIQHNDLCKMS